MRRFDKTNNLKKANILAEQRYLAPKTLKEIEFADTVGMEGLNIVQTDDKYILVNSENNTIEAEISPIKYVNSKEELCRRAFMVYNDLFEFRSNTYTGNGKVIGPLTSCGVKN